MNINWSFLWEKFVFQVIDLKGYETILTGLKNTLIIALVGFLIGLILGAILAIIQLLPKHPVSNFFKVISKGYIGLFRGTPIVVQLLLGWYVLKPILGIRGANALIWGTVIFGLNSAAYVAEIIRGGLESVDDGQLEAGESLGLSTLQIMVNIVLPQGLRRALPSLFNEFIALVKETSIVGTIGIIDITKVAANITARTLDPFMPYIISAVIY